MTIVKISLDSPIYNTPIKIRLRTGKTTALRTGGCDGTVAKIIRRAAIGWSRTDHDHAALYHNARYERLNSIWQKLLDKAMMQTHGRAMGVTDYKVCAIGRDEFPEAMKRVLRHCR